MTVVSSSTIQKVGENQAYGVGNDFIWALQIITGLLEIMTAMTMARLRTSSSRAIIDSVVGCMIAPQLGLWLF
jgi:hypothetical protein